MLRVTTKVDEEQGQVTLMLEGKLAGPWVEEFERCWCLALEKWKHLAVELAGVTFIDSKGKCLLAKIHGQGTTLSGTGLMTKSIIEEISGCEGKQQSSANGSGGSKPTLARAIILLRSLVIRFGAGASATGRSVAADTDPGSAACLEAEPAGADRQLESGAERRRTGTSRAAALLPQADFSILDSAERFNIYAQFGKRFPGIAQHGGPFQFFQAGPELPCRYSI